MDIYEGYVDYWEDYDSWDGGLYKNKNGAKKSTDLNCVFHKFENSDVVIEFFDFATKFEGKKIKMIIEVLEE